MSESLERRVSGRRVVSLPQLVARRLVQSTSMAQDKREFFFRNLVAAATVDGEIGEEERKALAWYGQRLGIGESEFVAALAMASGGALKLVMPTDPSERGWMLELLARIVHADGEVRPRERQLLVAYGRRMGLSNAELQRFLEKREGDGGR